MSPSRPPLTPHLPLTFGGSVPADLLGHRVPAHPHSSAFPLRARFGPEAPTPTYYFPVPTYTLSALITLLPLPIS